MQDPSPSPAAALGFDDIYRDARVHSPALAWNYAAKGWFRRGETSVLYGPSNCGKSALVCHLGNCIVTGGPFFGAPVRQGVVVHVGAEAPESVLDRMQAFRLSDNPEALPYIVRMQPVVLSAPDAVGKFVTELERLRHNLGQPIILIVFDTLARSLGTADENCASTMTGIADTAGRIARQLDAHVMLVHHTGKDAKQGGRGSSALRGAVDTEISLWPTRGTVVRVVHEKQRTMRKGEARFFETRSFVLGQDEDGDDRTTVMAVDGSSPPEKEVDGSGPPDKENANNRGAVSKYDTAVLTALHIRRLNSARGNDPFKPRDILESVPPEIFGSMSDENRMNTIRRVLARLAEQKPPVVEKSGQDWRLSTEAAPT
ncbi:AAA family ATPase [Limimaricola sp. G21655-S1]|uniref:AAA family ATPase n=1 Tax=Limimaricola sp. G21655-S1 TaxID=3014768 RepID=UPI0022AFF94E|nr:AAA family ATPase [Limimaricola sp. G21655-S1]MCZ4262604.1 AAA family ATPase [Limimaricola sp. G21655-S1]